LMTSVSNFSCASAFIKHLLWRVLFFSIRLLKNVRLRRFPHPSSLQRTSKYTSLLSVSGAWHLDIFEQPGKIDFFRNC
jgi:hypothetical protein